MVFKNPKFGLEKQGLMMGSMCHIEQHNTNHKYEKLNYVILHKMTSQLKLCRNPMDFQIKALKETKLPNSPQYHHGCILAETTITNS